MELSHDQSAGLARKLRMMSSKSKNYDLMKPSFRLLWVLASYLIWKKLFLGSGRWPSAVSLNLRKFQSSDTAQIGRLYTKLLEGCPGLILPSDVASAFSHETISFQKLSGLISYSYYSWKFE